MPNPPYLLSMLCLRDRPRSPVPAKMPPVIILYSILELAPTGVVVSKYNSDLS